MCHTTMTGEHLDAILKAAQAGKADKDGFASLPEGMTLTLYAAHDGATLTLARIEAVRVEGELVYARNSKRDTTYLVARGDLFAASVDGNASGTGGSPRRAGFSAA